MLERSIKIPWAEEAREMAEEETAEQKTKASSHQFIPKLVGQKITIRPAQGQPITGILRGYNPYELLIEVGPKQIIVFKSSIWCIEIMG
jgi:sRNA-binding regulator protein Hfq